MDAEAAKQVTIGEALIWVGMTFDYTEQVAALVPEDLLDWRHEDPNGGFVFSLAEILMHVADARRMFASQLRGDEEEPEYWATSEGPDEKGVWTFKQYDGRQAILDSLKETSALFDDYLNMPIDKLLDTPEGAIRSFEKTLAWMREHEHPTEQAERRGPANINRVLMAVCAHEAGHRGSLYTLLRMNGVELKEAE